MMALYLGGEGSAQWMTGSKFWSSSQPPGWAFLGRVEWAGAGGGGMMRNYATRRQTRSTRASL